MAVAQLWMVRHHHAMKIIRHKKFVGPKMYWNFQGLDANREKYRQQAEAFVNEIGVENVVSIAEHVTSNGPFSVVVWYKADA